MRVRLALALALASCLAGCPDDESAGTPVDGLVVDGGVIDRGVVDAALDAAVVIPDLGMVDGGPPDMGPDQMVPDMAPDQMVHDMGPDQMVPDMGPEQMVPDMAADQMVPDMGPDQMVPDMAPDQMPPPADEDGDGIPDDLDNCPRVGNAEQADADEDGEGDACDPDDDNDGVLDADDCAPTDAAAGACVLYYADRDADEFGDAADSVCACGPADVYTTTSRTDCDDGDGAAFPGGMEICDGIDQNCDQRADEGFPDQDADAVADCVDPDVDGDEIPNAGDNCPTLLNPDQLDLDADGLGDACDDDDDADGVLDDADNCPRIANPDQTDSSGNGRGDPCDDGADSDGVTDALDNCPAVGNPNQADFDADGAGDACDDDDDDDGDPDATDCARLDPAVHHAAQEQCDGVDTNCDGTPDNGVDALGCDILFLDVDADGFGDAEQAGRCYCAPTDGFRVRIQGDCDDAVGAVNPDADEVCNGVDDNCVEGVDELWPELGQACDGADADVCADGRIVCSADQQAAICDDGPNDAAERCNGADDDCDGQVDEVWSDVLGDACDGPDADLCANGVLACAADGLDVVCGAEDPADVEEICDGEDNDCDGAVDEGFADVVEVCNGVDDDCNGAVDDAPQGDGEACDAPGQLGVCAVGAQRCEGGVQICAALAEPADEACNDLDDDCDGVIDEDGPAPEPDLYEPNEQIPWMVPDDVEVPDGGMSLGGVFPAPPTRPSARTNLGGEGVDCFRFDTERIEGIGNRSIFFTCRVSTEDPDAQFVLGIGRKDGERWMLNSPALQDPVRTSMGMDPAPAVHGVCVARTDGFPACAADYTLKCAVTLHPDFWPFVCDDWYPGDAPCAVDIYDVKRAGWVADGVDVTVDGVVTAVRLGADGAIDQVALQVPEDSPAYDGAADSGVWIFAGNAQIELPEVRRGQHLQVTGSVNTFFGQRQLQRISAVEILAADQPLPADTVLTPRRALLSQYEGVLVTVEDVAVTDVDPEPGPGDRRPTFEFVVDDDLRVNDFLYRLDPVPPVDALIPSITGVLRLGNGNQKLEPRDAADIDLGPAGLVSFGPDPVLLVLGEDLPPHAQDGAFLTVRLDRQAPAGGQRIDLEFNNEIMMLPGDVDHIIVPQGALEAVVPLTPVAVGEGAVTARLDAVELTVQVQVLAEAPPREITLTIPNQVLAGALFTVTIAMDVPAPAPGIDLQIMGEGPVRIDTPDVQMPAGARSVNVDLFAEAPGLVTLSVTAPDTPHIPGQADFEIVAAQPGGTLVINEIDYDQPGGDTAEFVELYNRTDAPLALAGLALEMVNGSNGQVYGTYVLADAAAEIPAGGYLVVGVPAVVAELPAGVLSLEMPVNGLQNGSPDGVRIVNGEGGVLDGIAYEGAMDGVTEGDPAVAEDLGVGSIGRCPNGADTNDNASNFVHLEEPTAGAANNCVD